MNKKEYIIPVFIPFLGCPHDCAFCNQVKITNHRDKADVEATIGIIEKNLEYFPINDNIKEIAFFGGSFTGLDEATMTAYLKIAYDYKKKGIIDRIRLSTRPDYINNSILKILKSYEVDIIELGIQSMDDSVLMSNDRGHSSDDSRKASRLIKDYGFTLGHQIMPGLYNDRRDLVIKTAIESAKISPDLVRIYPTLVIKDTRLERLYKMGLYEPLSLDEAVSLSAECLMIYETMGINVIRLGLQVTENINEGEDVIAGPFHPAIRQLVESFIYRNYIKEIIEGENINGDIEIYTDDRSISIIAGNKRSNKEYFYKNYRVKLNFKSIRKGSYLLYEGKKIDLDIKKYMKDHVKNTYGGELKLD